MNSRPRRTLLKALALVLALPLVLGGCAGVSCKVQPTSLGIPLAARYPDTPAPRAVWDMVVYDGVLYVGSGDYDQNAGPVEVWGYDLSTETWQSDGTLPDEELTRFVELDGTLCVPGTDPRGDWQRGNFYRRGDRGWETVRTLPGGIHNFDLVHFHGDLFAGIGVARGGYPLLRSTDGGATFATVPMERDGHPLDTQNGECVRCYDLFVKGDTLYATFWFEDQVKNEINHDLYRYQDEKFIFDNSWIDKIRMLPIRNVPIGGKEVVNDRLYLATGALVTTRNMTDTDVILFPHSEVVYDLLQDDGVLYVLCAREQEDGWRVAVWENRTGEPRDFHEKLYFSYPLPALSFAKDGDTFYFGMGERAGDHPENGTILQATAK